jgi:cytochrome c biogenesis protein CcmG/thiol:disulfide interchange protein DsbE
VIVRRRKWSGPAVVLGFVGTLIGACNRSDDRMAVAFKPLDVGVAVPAYAVVGLDGDTIAIGGRGPVTVLNVWATWCESCREEMEGLDSLRREYTPRGARVVAISVDQGATEKVRRFAESNDLTITVAHDQAATINAMYNVVGVPTTFIIGPDGLLVWRHTGNVVSVMAEARAAMEQALALVR